LASASKAPGSAVKLDHPRTGLYLSHLVVADVDEHRAWAGVRFSLRTDVLRFVAAAKGRKDNDNLLAVLCARSDIDAEFSLYPRGATTGISDRGLMPTSAARLVLASGWFETL